MVFQLVVQQRDPLRQTSVVHLLASLLAGLGLVSLDGLFPLSQTPSLSGRQTIRWGRLDVVMRSPDVTQYPGEVPIVSLDGLAALVSVKRFLVVDLPGFAAIDKFQRGQSGHGGVTHLLRLMDHVHRGSTCSPQHRVYHLVWHVRPSFLITAGTWRWFALRVDHKPDEFALFVPGQMMGPCCSLQPSIGAVRVMVCLDLLSLVVYFHRHQIELQLTFLLRHNLIHSGTLFSLLPTTHDKVLLPSCPCSKKLLTTLTIHPHAIRGLLLLLACVAPTRLLVDLCMFIPTMFLDLLDAGNGV